MEMSKLKVTLFILNNCNRFSSIPADHFYLVEKLVYIKIWLLKNTIISCTKIIHICYPAKISFWRCVSLKFTSPKTFPKNTLFSYELNIKTMLHRLFGICIVIIQRKLFIQIYIVVYILSNRMLICGLTEWFKTNKM